MTNNHRKEVQTKLKKGLLDMIILQYLNHKSMHGYKLITEISKDFGVYVGNGSIYPVLRILEKKGYVKSTWTTDAEKPRKVFSLTSKGKSFLRFTEVSFKFICKNMMTDYKIQIQAARIPSDRLMC